MTSTRKSHPSWKLVWPLVSVLAGSFVTGGLTVVLFTSIPWDTSWATAAAVHAFLLRPVVLPFWGVVLVSLCSLALMVGAVLLLVRELGTPEHRFYMFDRVLGIDWRWSWRRHAIVNLSPQCPSCGTGLDMNNVYDGQMCEVVCTGCDFASPFTECDAEELVGRVERHIHRRVQDQARVRETFAGVTHPAAE